jgi:hypothetical protein
MGIAPKGTAMPHDQGHNTVVADLIVRAQTLRDEFARLRRELSVENAAHCSIVPPVITRRSSEQSRQEARAEYWRGVREWATRTRRIESDLSAINPRLMKLIPQIKRALILCVARRPEMASALAGYNQLSLAVAPGETILRRDSVIPDLDTMIGLLQVCLGKQRGHRMSSNLKATTLKTLKQEIMEMRKEGLSQSQICDRLGDRPRPPRSSWQKLSWTEAFRHPRFHQAVKTWLSKP